MNNNEIMGYTGIVQKAGQALPKNDILVVDYEKRRERYDCYGRKQIAYSGRGSRDSQSVNKDSETTYYLWRIGGTFSRHSLQSEPRSFGQIPCQNQGTRTRQKIKPACGWHGTIENLVATSTLPSVLRTPGKRPRDSLPVLIIQNLARIYKVLCIRGRVCDRKCIPMHTIPLTAIPLYYFAYLAGRR